MKTLFVDTNIFLQCRDLKDLPWQEFTKGNDLLLLIPRAVQKQIDRLKHDGNSRRARRARIATSFIRQVVLAEGSIVIIKGHDPKVMISFPPPYTLDNIEANGIDMSNEDDLIVAEALAYKAEHPGDEVAIITHDTNPILTAKRFGLACIVLPDDWLLPPEPDLRDKRIAQLEQKIRELEGGRPEITVEAFDASGKIIDSLILSIAKYNILANQEIDRLLNIAKTKHPLVTDFSTTETVQKHHERVTALSGLDLFGVKQHYECPKEEEIAKYRDKDYPAWLEELRNSFRELASKLENSGRQVNISVTISNHGTVPAENVVVEFQVLGNLLLKPPSDADEKPSASSIMLPGPPKRPRGRWVREKTAMDSILETYKLVDSFSRPEYSLLRDIHLSRTSQPRDRHAFYWKSQNPFRPTSSWSFECAEFRHQVEPEEFDIILCVLPSVDAESGALQCRVTARNLARPLNFLLPVRISYEEHNTLKEAQQLLESLRE
jgi:hypothetical protein